MPILILILLIVFFLALYPVLRDLTGRRRYVDADFTDGLVFYLAGEKEKAIKKFKDLVMKNSDFVDAYLYLIDLYLEQGARAKALKISEALSLRRNLPREKEIKILKKLATLQVLEGRYSKAITLLEELMRIAPKEKDTTKLLFTLYLKTENYSSAEKLLDRLTTDLIPSEELASYYAELGRLISPSDHKRGQELLEKSLKFDNTSIPGLYHLGEYYYKQDEFERAAEYWYRLLKAHPETFYLVAEKLASAYYSLNRYEEIEKIYSEIGTTTHQPEYYIALAEFYEKKELLNEAIRTLENYPYFNPKVSALLTKYYLKNGQVERALGLEEKILTEYNKEQSLRCQNCQKEFKDYSAYCSNCWAWRTIKPSS